MISQQIKFLKEDLITSTHKFNRKIYHFRLGDFFQNEKQEIDFIHTNIFQLDFNSVVISNRDDLFKASDDIKKKLEKKGITYIFTENYNSLNLLNFFSSFSHISSNGSTIALWASIFGNCGYTLINTKNLSKHENNMKLLKSFFNNI